MSPQLVQSDPGCMRFCKSAFVDGHGAHESRVNRRLVGTPSDAGDVTDGSNNCKDGSTCAT